MDLSDQMSAAMIAADRVNGTGERRDDDIDLDDGTGAAGFDGIERRIKALQSLVRIVQTIDKLVGGNDVGGKDVGGKDAWPGSREAAEPADDQLDILRRELERRLDRAVATG